jgi:1-acyl-sn-glycerol-3-phosphate acyltransferase
MTEMTSPASDNRVIAFFHTIAIYLWVIFATVIIGTIIILVSFLPKSEKFIHNMARVWGRSIVWISRIKVKIRGLEHIRPSHAVIYMSNHQSNYDIPVYFSALPVQFRWLAKAELFKIPIFGRAMRGAGYISIDRSDLKSALRSMKRAAVSIRNGTSVLIFPEGTRTRDGALLPFKTGGFSLAIDAGVPIVPLGIQGTRRVMAKGRKLIHRGEVCITLMPAVETTAYTRKTKNELMDRVHASISAAMALENDRRDDD